MALHDFQCPRCDIVFEELHKQDEIISCPACAEPSIQLVSKLADYTGHISMTVQYTTRRSPDRYKDSFITKTPKDPVFLSKPVQHQRVGQ